MAKEPDWTRLDGDAAFVQLGLFEASTDMAGEVAEKAGAGTDGAGSSGFCAEIHGEKGNVVVVGGSTNTHSPLSPQLVRAHALRASLVRGAALMRVALVVTLLLFLCSLACHCELIDPDQESFFLSLDKDKDGDLDEDELRQFVKRQVREQAFDEESEIEGGVAIALARIDADNDKQLKHEDLVKQWVALATIMTPSDVREWLVHAIGVARDVAHKFESGGVTGLQLPLLLDPIKGPRLLAAIDVKLDRVCRSRLWAAIQLRMLGVGSVPPAPPLVVGNSSPRCGVVALSWSPVTTSLPETHTYRLFRRKSREAPALEDPWELVYEGKATAFSDRHVALSTLFDYKLEAWNLIGSSPSTELHDVAPLTSGCASTESSLVALVRLFEQILSPLYHASALFVAAFFLFKSATRPTIVAPLQPSSTVLPLPNQRLSVDDLPELASHALASSSGRSRSSELDDTAGPQSASTCRKCRKSITRTTRHICGSCQYTFCMTCTVYHPHLDVRTPLGKRVASPCGIDSKCRCEDCYVVQKQLQQ